MRRVATAVTYREPRLVRGVLIKVVKMISEMYVLAKAALAAKLGGTTKSSSHGCKTGTGAFFDLERGF